MPAIFAASQALMENEALNGATNCIILRLCGGADRGRKQSE